MDCQRKGVVVGNKKIIDFIFRSCSLLADVFKKKEKKNKTRQLCTGEA